MRNSFLIPFIGVGIVLTVLISIIIIINVRNETEQGKTNTRIFSKILTLSGVALVLVLVADFPFYSLYDFILQNMVILVGGGRAVPGSFLDFLLSGLPDNSFPFRLKLTLAAVVISATLVLLMSILKTSCQKLNLKLFQRILSWGRFYEVIMTLLMLLGMWLDLHPWAPNDPSIRVGFLFYLNYH